MSKTAKRAAHSIRCICHGNGYWFAGSRRVECGYRPCVSCGNSRYQPDKAGIPYRCEYCTETLFPAGAELGVPPVSPMDADLSRIRVSAPETMEEYERLHAEMERARAERKAATERPVVDGDLARLVSAG